MKLSKLASDIAESPTLALNEEARVLRERGEAVINARRFAFNEKGGHPLYRRGI